MMGFSRPTIVASLLLVGALLLHPAVRSADWAPGRTLALPAVLLLLVVALGSRAVTATGRERLPAVLLAAGVALAVLALGLDGVRGHRGSLELLPDQVESFFDEVAPDGRSVGRRPLGFNVAVERTLSDGGVALVLGAERERRIVRPTRAVGQEGYRFAHPRTALTGEAALLRIGISGDEGSTVVDLQPGRGAEAGDLRIGLEQYFPDFELEDGERPRTKSLEPNNPAAVLTIRSPEGSFRAFVIRALPGVHRVEALGRSFSLLDVEPKVSIRLDVFGEPFALVVLLGGLVALAGVALSLPWRAS